MYPDTDFHQVMLMYIFRILHFQFLCPKRATAMCSIMYKANQWDVAEWQHSSLQLRWHNHSCMQRNLQCAVHNKQQLIHYTAAFTAAPLCRWQFGLVANVVGRINEVNQRRARLVLGRVTVFKTGKPSLYVTSHPGQLSLAIPLWVGKMSTGDDCGHHQGRNGEFCVTVGPVTRTAHILIQSVIWRTWAVC